MKVGYISTYLPTRCGIATYTYYLLKGIKKIIPSLNIKIIAEEGAQRSMQDTLEVIPCWNRNTNYITPIIEHAKNIDIIHIQHEYSIYKFDDRLPQLLRLLDKSAKKIITIHCIRPGQFSRFSEEAAVEENFTKTITELADAVIVHLSSQAAILSRLGIAAKKIYIITHGSELNNENKKEARKKLNLPINKAKIILIFGFIKRHKCIDVALEALNEIRKKIKDVYLFIASGLAPGALPEDKEYAEFIAKKIASLKLNNNVIYPMRFFPNEDVPYLFAAADIVLFPYYEEDRSASGSFHLAIGAKKPVVASRIPKFEELKNISDELLILPYNHLGIANVIMRLFEEAKFRQYVINRTDEYRRLTSWTTVAKQHIKLYKKIYKERNE